MEEIESQIIELLNEADMKLSKKEFTASDMIEFANWYGEDITEMELRSFRDVLKQRAEQEYQLYLKLKAKYE